MLFNTLTNGNEYFVKKQAVSRTGSTALLTGPGLFLNEHTGKRAAL